MSLLRLLSAGKSLMGVKDADSPYRMTTRNLLPKFVSAKNPFAPAPKPEPAPGAGVRVPILAAKTADPEPAKLETMPLFDAQTTKPAAQESMMMAGQMISQPREEPKADHLTPVARAGQPMMVAKWFKRLNPFSHRRKTGSPAKELDKPKKARSPMQTELSLERVRVIRNELNDSDLELIPQRMGELRRRSPGAPSAAAKPDQTRWGRLTSRFLREGQTQTR